MFKIKNLYVILAREVSTDAADKMNSIIKVIDRFTFTVNRKQFASDQKKLAPGQQIALPANYAVATSWVLSEKLQEETFLNFKVTIIDPAGKDMGGPEQENLLPAGVNRVNMNFNVQGLPVTTAGSYILRAHVADKNGEALNTGDYPFEVELVDGPLASRNPLA